MKRKKVTFEPATVGEIAAAQPVNDPRPASEIAANLMWQAQFQYQLGLYEEDERDTLERDDRLARDEEWRRRGRHRGLGMGGGSWSGVTLAGYRPYAIDDTFYAMEQQPDDNNEAMDLANNF